LGCGACFETQHHATIRAFGYFAMLITRRAQLTNFLGLERNVTIASAAVFLLGLGEELWKKFLPKYLEALGAIYVPAGKIADRVGRKPFVTLTFISFALFPLAVIAASSFALLVVAFIIGGLREIGEPARKAMIVDFAREDVRARSVGLYYLIRSLSITPAAAVGGFLWKIAPEVPFAVAGLIGLLGTIVFAATVEERFAS
jgi:MFS family permease